MAEGLQNPNLSLDELYEQGRSAQPELDAFGRNFLQYLQEKYPDIMNGVYFEQAPLKKMERVVEKVDGDYGGNHSRLADIVRGRFLAETPEQIDIIRQEMNAMRSQLGIEKFKDFYATPLATHFRSLNTQVRMPSGHVAEFRVDQYDMAIESSKNHKLYEEQQSIERLAKQEGRPFTPEEVEKYRLLLEEQRAGHDRAAHKNNLDSLLDERGTKLIEAHRSQRSQDMADAFESFGKKAGPIAGVVAAVGAGGFTLFGGGSVAEASEVMYETAVPYG